MALGGFALALRLLWLGADPAADLTWSGAPFTDEGLYSHVARWQALSGALPSDGWDNRLVSPLWDRLVYAVFVALGAGYVQLRLINVVLACAALLLFWGTLRRDIGLAAATAAALLWAADYAWFQYSRLGLLEPGMLALLIAAGYCWRRALDGGRWWSRGAGLLAGGAAVWKSLALVWVAAPLLALALIDPALPRRRVAAGYCGGLALALAAYTLLWYLPHREAIAAYNEFYAAGRVPASGDVMRVVLGNLLSRELGGMAPVLALAALPGAVLALGAALGRRLAPSPALCLLWALCSSGLLVSTYSPSRYWVPLLPALCGLAGYALWALRARGMVIGFGLVAALVLAALVWDVWWYARWAARREWTLETGSQRLEQLTAPGSLVLGVAACGLSPGNTLPCAPPFAGLTNDERPVERLGARYAVAEIGSRDDYMRRWYADLLARSRLVERMRIGPREYGLYELDR